jgi:hypothetical protein
MKVNVVNYETGYGENWVFTALAEKINYGFDSLGFISKISKSPLDDFDMFLHISYGQANNLNHSKINFAYVTHIDEVSKLNRVISLARDGVKCLCMSDDTAWRLNKLSLTDNFHGVRTPSLQLDDSYSKSLKLVFSYRLYNDGRKNIDDVYYIIEKLSKSVSLEITIIGSGWESFISKINENLINCKVFYVSNFNKESYVNALRECDFLVYTGLDEGSISFLDALVFGKNVLVTAQGFHLEYSNISNVYLYSGRQQLDDILIEISREKIDQNKQYVELTSWGSYCDRIINCI